MIRWGINIAVAGGFGLKEALDKTAWTLNSMSTK
jgi:hypothetical protein